MINCRIEPTVLAEMTNDGSMPGLESRNAGHVIEPSSRDPSDDFQEEETESKFLNKHLQNLFSLKLFRTRVVVTYTTVTQIIYTATSTKTFFIQKCTPSPFYFELCNRRRQIDLSTTEV
jgi:hypothetical protein